MTKPERPSQTPDGLSFPFSHFGDTDKRTRLLQDIACAIKLDPKLVINMGSGYDITPSDAFPDARVIHVDIDPPEYMQDDTVNIVNFLQESGFEAYTPSDLPAELQADLAISILAPRVDDELIAPGGVLLETIDDRYVPEGMQITGLVEYVDEEPKIISNPIDMQELWSSDREIHLVAFMKDHEI